MTDQSKGFHRAVPVMREMSIRAALEWAFSAELVSIEFDEIHDGPGGVDTIWRLMQRGRLGCKVDGGGRTMRHDDAEVIASFVGSLSAELGGRGMAVRIAQLARCCDVPDWMPGAVPRCVPVEVVQNPHGTFSRTVVVGQGFAVRPDDSWPTEVVRRGRRKRYESLVCPVDFLPRASKIASVRRAYTEWWCALLELRVGLAHAGLRTISITQQMPPRKPWDTSA